MEQDRGMTMPRQSKNTFPVGGEPQIQAATAGIYQEASNNIFVLPQMHHLPEGETVVGGKGHWL